VESLHQKSSRIYDEAIISRMIVLIGVKDNFLPLNLAGLTSVTFERYC